MPLFDLPEADLLDYRTDTREPEDLDGWWAERLAAARKAAWPTRLTRYRSEVYGPTPVWDVEFAGAHGDPIRAWYLRPAGSEGMDLPLVVSYIGYGGGRGVPTEHLVLPSAGFANLVMDTRGQGGAWTCLFIHI
jgi:cephalosporin-C deacetylase